MVIFKLGPEKGERESPAESVRWRGMAQGEGKACAKALSWERTDPFENS